jgi:hypothetical protein
LFVPSAASISAACHGCSASLVMPVSSDGEQMLALLRPFLEKHRTCGYHLSVRVPRQRPPQP